LHEHYVTRRTPELGDNSCPSFVIGIPHLRVPFDLLNPVLLAKM
jgi:hypothetical protein